MMDKIIKNSMYGTMNGKKNFIEALSDTEKILDIVADFDDVAMMSLISTLIDATAAQAGVDPGELAYNIAETVVAVNDIYGYIYKNREV